MYLLGKVILKHMLWCCRKQWEKILTILFFQCRWRIVIRLCLALSLPLTEYLIEKEQKSVFSTILGSTSVSVAGIYVWSYRMHQKIFIAHWMIPYRKKCASGQNFHLQIFYQILIFLKIRNTIYVTEYVK